MLVKKTSVLIAAGFVLALLLQFRLSIRQKPVRLNAPDEHMEEILRPADFFYMQRSYPYFEFDIAAYHNALRGLVSMNKTASVPGRLQSAWQLEGPSNIGGRINAIAVHPTNNQIVLLGCATGGIFKTTNGGGSWAPVFDDQPWLAIADITYDPGNPNTIWAGTGDPNVSGYPFIGDGIYRSTDGGTTWQHKGLDSVRVISKIRVHPTNSNIVYVSAMGYPMARNNHRGVYKTTDGGNTWTQVHFVSNQAGIIDLVMDPQNPQVLYASGWDRIRTNQESLVYGSGAKIWKTTDGGANWNMLTNGLPSTPMSRVNLAVAQNNPMVLYASYVDTTLDIAGIYRSNDAGASWSALPNTGLDPACLAGFGWYFANIFVNPLDSNDVFLCGLQLWRSTDAGQNWATNDPDWWLYDVHADKHDMAFLGASSYLLATDGGTYLTTDGGTTWSDYDELPNSQCYRVASTPFQPGQYFTGLQDNGTTSGNSSIMNAWPRIFGGDGFTTVFDPVNPNNFVVTTQNSGFNFTDDGGVNFYPFTNGIDPNDRTGWDAPILINKKNPDTYYTGTYRVYRITDGIYGLWDTLSPDLTDGNIFGARFHTISAIELDGLDTTRIFAGTTDGNVWISTNTGTTWNDITTGLPNRYVTSLRHSPNTPGTFYVTHSGYKSDEYIPHLHKSTNNGAAWTDLSGDLPQVPLNDVEVFPGSDSILVVASDAGVYVSQNWGQNWNRLGTGMPVIPVYDILFDTTMRVLIAGSHARSLWTFPMDSLVPYIAPVDTNDTTVNRVLPFTGSEIRVYPNPVRDVFQVSLNGMDKGLLEVSDISGKIYLRQHVSGNYSGEAGSWPAGIYFCRFTTERGEKKTAKFLKL